MRLMYDGIAAHAVAIPADARMVAGYVDGLYRWSDADWARFPHAVKVRIAVFATTPDGHVLDCEPGNCAPGQSVDWVLMRRRAGVDPTVYCNENDLATGWPAVRAAFRARGVTEPHYWVANYDGITQIPAGAIAKQYRDAGTYDLSVVADHWPGVDPAPAPPTIRRNDMHVDLRLGDPVVFTNPAAVLGGQAHLCLSSDFGDARVRVASMSFKTGAWSVVEQQVGRTAGALSVPLDPDTNKLSVTLLSVSPQAGAPRPPAVGLDVIA